MSQATIERLGPEDVHDPCQITGEDRESHFGAYFWKRFGEEVCGPHAGLHRTERMLDCCLVIVRHGRRLWVSFGVTANPTAEWISRQVTEAFSWDCAPRYLIRDRDTSYGAVFLQRIRALGIRDHPIAPRSPWQNAYVERLIGSIRRECLDHMIVFGEAHLRRTLRGYAAYYNVSRTHQSLNKDAPLHRAIERLSYRPKLVTAGIGKAAYRGGA
jgi:transposase InsO family protein